ncbi:MAG: hypothetical protein ACPGVN_08200 [Alphaproteobacteria bacterium]
MQQRSSDGTRMERTGWRDESISRRHRDWGFNCPAVDLDFLVVEYNLGKPVALIEYKHFKAQKPNFKHATYRALRELGDISGLPFMVAFYWPESWSFCVSPQNQIARDWFGEWEPLTEYDYVNRLYEMRQLVLDTNIKGKLLRVMPPHAA